MPTEKLITDDGMLKIGWGRGRPDINIGCAESESPADQGWFMPLTSRDQVNWAIRTLRRARDGAFGKDE